MTPRAQGLEARSVRKEGGGREKVVLEEVHE
jgi:hypothetical protein